MRWRLFRGAGCYRPGRGEGGEGWRTFLVMDLGTGT